MSSMKNILFYVSGHGYGHATRTAEIIRALFLIEPTWKFYVRSKAPAEFFQSLCSPSQIQIDAVTIDSGVVENKNDPFHIDPPSTLNEASKILANKEQTIKSELKFIKDHSISLIVTDIAYLAGDIALATGIPCTAISNFTWDWIYEPFVTDYPNYKGLLEEIRDSYRKIPILLELPFCDHDSLSALFEKSTIFSVNLLARQSKRDPKEILNVLGLDNKLPFVLIGKGRGGVSLDALEKAANDSKDFIFLTMDSQSTKSSNIHHITSSLNYIDILSISSIVISKLGYSIVAECIANKAFGLLSPPRFGFREDMTLKTKAPNYLRMSEIPLKDYEEGQWANHLNRLLKIDKQFQTMDLGGAEECARHIVQIMGGKSLNPNNKIDFESSTKSPLILDLTNHSAENEIINFLTPEVMQELRRVGQEKIWESGECLMLEGEEGHTMDIIEEGTVEVLIKNTNLSDKYYRRRLSAEPNRLELVGEMEKDAEKLRLLAGAEYVEFKTADKLVRCHGFHLDAVLDVALRARQQEDGK